MGRTRTLKHVTQPSSLMNSDISTWRHVISVDKKPENQQLAKQMQCCLPRLPRDHAPTKRRESKGSLQPSKPCWGRAAPAQHVKHGRQSITLAHVGAFESGLMFGVQNGDIRRVAHWRARVGGRCCCVRLGVYHMSAVDFVVWRGENIAKGVVVVK